MSTREEICTCKNHCCDTNDEIGTCKGLPQMPKPPLVEVVLVPRRSRTLQTDRVVEREEVS